MKYQEELDKRELAIEDLPKSQHKKIAELKKLFSKIEEIEGDVDDESREEFESIKIEANRADEEIVMFIKGYDVEKARAQRARLAEMRSRIKKPTTPPADSTPAPAASTPASAVSAPVANESAPVVEEIAPVEESAPAAAPVKKDEQSIAQHIEEIKKEAKISPEHFEEKPVQVQEEAIEVDVEEFEKQGERKPRKVNVPLVIMGVGALLLTFGAVNFFKERR